MKVCSNDPGHVSKMTTMHGYGKNPLKIYFSETIREADDLETWYTAMRLEPYTVCLNDDPWLTLTFFMARSNSLPNTFVREMLKH